MSAFKDIAIAIGRIGLRFIETLVDKQTYEVVKVYDGDSITVLNSNEDKLKIRLAYIDAPEIARTTEQKKSRKHIDKSQFKWGAEAKERLEELIAESDGKVSLTIIGKDRYDRNVCEVRLADGSFVQEVLVKEGLALVYRPYVKDEEVSKILEAAEANAKRYKRGIWKDPKFIPAWEFRSQK